MPAIHHMPCHSSPIPHPCHGISSTSLTFQCTPFDVRTAFSLPPKDASTRLLLQEVITLQRTGDVEPPSAATCRAQRPQKLAILASSSTNIRRSWVPFDL